MAAASPPYHFPICTSSRLARRPGRAGWVLDRVAGRPRRLGPMTVAPSIRLNASGPSRTGGRRSPRRRGSRSASSSARAELRGDPLDRLLGQDAFAVVPVGAVGEHGGCGDGAEDHRVAGDRAAEHQLAQRVDHLAPSAVRHATPSPSRQVALRLGHQPHAHARDDAEPRDWNRPSNPTARSSACRHARRGCSSHGAGPVRTSPHRSAADLEAADVLRRARRTACTRRRTRARLPITLPHPRSGTEIHSSAPTRAPPRTARRSSRRARPPRTPRRRRSRARDSSGAG